ncbi:MAG: hypothetical protein A3F72_00460 [Bacteroidetes bacterium RIFCSPLOWO2_12_FULL_35_15]|nr:MAG: hypothetical protein A3F72_00460 [Bacteroidetes bacterium RIFCSPLOWO2_12_FULL_35_15]
MNSNKRKFLFTLIVIIISNKADTVFAQSTNCATATSLTITAGSGCANGTTVGAISDNTFYATCNPSPTTVNEVWYTYVTNGSNNNFTITPGTLTNTEFILYTGGCPGTAGAVLQTCATATGSSVLNATWGLPAGIQVWIGVASVAGTQGTFQLCVTSNPPSPDPGNTCALAIPLCNFNAYTLNPMVANSSGQTPDCFLDPAQRDVWFKFTVTQSGLLAWKATPALSTTEFDWTLWDITAGCPGTEVCCNYHYANGSSNGFGMQAVANVGTCNDQSYLGNANQEFSPPQNVTCGKTYAIQISNYSNTNKGFTISYAGSTCLISSNAAFTAAPTLFCGGSMTVNITNTSTGACNGEVWNFGDGSAPVTTTGTTAPPAHTYSTPGTYAITATIGGTCPSTATQYVKLYGPLAATATPVNATCSCNGSASITSVTGGNGVYTYSWAPGGQTTPTITGLCPGTYTCTISNAACGTSIIKTVTIAINPLPTATISGTTSVCQNGSAPTITFTGADATSAYTFTYTINGGGSQTVSSVAPGSTATITAPTGTTGAFVYNLVSVLSANGCSQIQTGSATVTINPSPTATISGTASICQNGTAPTVTFTGVNATSAYTFTYTINGGANQTVSSVAPGSTAIVTAPTGTGGAFVYNLVSVSSVNGCSQTQTGSATVTVTPLPTATISGTASICQNSAAPGITFTGASATSAYTFTYTINGGANQTVSSIAPASTATVTVPTGTAGVFDYNLVSVSSANGCSQVQTGTAMVTINPSPTAFISGTASICENGAAPSIIFTGASATSAYTYTYTINGGTNQTVSGVAPDSTATVIAPTGTAGAFVYNLVSVSSANGCSQTQTGSATVTVAPLPTASISGTATICENGTAPIITFTGADATANYIFTYNIDGGVNQVVSSVAPGSIATVNAPTGTAGAFVYNLVSVSSANGCSQTQTGSATITVNPSPTVTVNSPLICPTQTATLTAGGATTYSWSPGLSSTTGVSVTGSPAVTTSYTVTGTSLGCSGTAIATITIGGNIVVTVNDTTICEGETATLTAQGAASYTWSAGLSSTTGATVTGSPATTSSYTVTGSTGGCNGTAVATITVNSLPVLVITNPATVCEPYTVNITVPAVTAGSTGNGTLSYWANAGATIAVTNPVAVAVNGTYYIQSLTAGGCRDIQPVTVAINSLPSLSITNPATVCSPNTVDITSPAVTAGSIGGGILSYWTSMAATTALTIPTAIATSGTYYIQTTTAAGCKDINPVLVTIDPLPILTITNPAAVCPSGTVDITVPAVTAFSTGGGTLSYWTDATATTPLTTPTAVATSGTYYIRTTTSAGCIDIKPVIVTINPLPTPVFAADNLSGCSPVCVNFTDGSTVAGGTITSWSWSFGGVGISNIQDPSFCFTIPGSYNVTLSATTNSGCTGISIPTVITVFQDPIAEFNPTPNPATVLDAAVTLNNQSSSDVTYWHWTFGDGDSLSPNIPSPTHTYPNDMPGNYAVTLIVHNGNGCYATISHDIIIAPEFTFYIPNAFTPNDDNNNDTFYGQGIGIAKYEIYIFDRWGNNVFYGDDINKAWDGKSNNGSLVGQEDVYVWKVKLFDLNGMKHNYIGTVTIVK